MATAAAKQFTALSQSLDPKLLRFFQRYPPVLASSTAASPESTDTTNASTPSTELPSLLPYQGPNPFQPHKHEITGLWHNSKFSSRRQSDLTKLAEKHGLESLLPSSVKSKEWRLDRRLHGLKVKGTGVGERVKGHWWERTLYTRLQKRRQAMLDMPNLIYRWKQLGHGRGWKKWPK
ncbi:MAG: hypothetical protein GOMPHAMPRED_005312 [Gomphillus americanus]|uniref:Large ribosomal subunit protein mL59 domain-containing protein n=1 Tax=Gomphillus americanus TaxID=1940652 RepID=A0A8H3FQQ9_9LECA|nr:MAG: hypothetical protein GOMPHAMPRED_005312 [Gomphillus americanus]